ncbi:U2 small nuclear ribonucleoprotein auxiliary factor 35 kDa subunit-related protein 2-like [Ornithodoros turicata]|uniref:U2 small nuclear ribonucleoprotein auxiliary factor 35 kDa subunit-related protein 2-like n=1 Tax=Ornithodoros turicata TaxID=34597 RepID=UPI0031394C9E
MLGTLTGLRVAKESHRKFRALLKKTRRKRIRQKAAQERDRLKALQEASIACIPGYREHLDEQRRSEALQEEYNERERKRQHQLWLAREAIAQQEFQIRKAEDEERARKKQEAIEALEKENKKKEDEKNEEKKKEESLKEAISKLPEGNATWHNPPAPPSYAEAPERETCPFYTKTGACRFGNRCSRNHPRPEVSRTLLLRGMYNHFSIGQQQRDDYDGDSHLETEERDLQQDFEAFYWDVLPELRSAGRVIQFKVCRNHEPHLRGNVYVQYRSNEEATRALMMFNGRWYAGRQISCEFTLVDRWKSAICGLFFRNACPKGKTCNFLHVFRNPTDEFKYADRDETPHRYSGSSSYRGHDHSHRYRRSPGSRRSPESRRSPGSRRSFGSRRSSERRHSLKRRRSRESKRGGEHRRSERKSSESSPKQVSERKEQRSERGGSGRWPSPEESRGPIHDQTSEEEWSPKLCQSQKPENDSEGGMNTDRHISGSPGQKSSGQVAPPTVRERSSTSDSGSDHGVRHRHKHKKHKSRKYSKTKKKKRKHRHRSRTLSPERRTSPEKGEENGDSKNALMQS